jgi:seryl-tRNA synthetase
MARIREILAALELRQTETLEKMEAIQNKMDQSPGPQQVNLLQEQMTALRTELEAATTELATLRSTLPSNPSPSVDDTLPIVPALNAPNDAPPAPARKRPRPDWS